MNLVLIEIVLSYALLIRIAHSAVLFWFSYNLKLTVNFAAFFCFQSIIKQWLIIQTALISLAVHLCHAKHVLVKPTTEVLV